MIVAFSTSSPLLSVATFSDGRLVGCGQGDADRNASTVCLRLMEELKVNLEDLTGLVADQGPGSFAGVRVGVVMAKALAWARGLPVAGVSSFDLVSSTETVSIPGRRGEWLVREPGQPARPSLEFVGVGYDNRAEQNDFPHARRLVGQIGQLEWLAATQLLPEYVLAPNISQPKVPYKREAT